jgi:hypothetical protein
MLSPTQLMQRVSAIQDEFNSLTLQLRALHEEEQVIFSLLLTNAN